jgi:hypothetical protein
MNPFLDEIGVSPNILGVAKGDGAQLAVVAFMRSGEDARESSREIFIVLKPLEEMQLSLATFDKFNHTSADRKVVLRFSWRTTRYMLPFKRNVKIKTSVFDIRAMKDAKEEMDD